MAARIGRVHYASAPNFPTAARPNLKSEVLQQALAKLDPAKGTSMVMRCTLVKTDPCTVVPKMSESRSPEPGISSQSGRILLRGSNV
jgi:hypothetical protein